MVPAQHVATKTGRRSPPAVLGRFTLERLLARSASGSTWLAIDAQDIDRPTIALKLMSGSYGALFKRHSVFAERLERLRGRALTGLPTLRSFGREQGQHYVAFSWRGGDPLDEVLASGIADLSTADRNRLVSQLANALNALHWGGFLHLSLSPSTILYQPGTKSLRLADWGHMLPTSDAASIGLSFPGVSLDVAPYTSAAAMAGDPLDVRDDVYAFGCVAYELLTGAHPFDRRSAHEAATLGLVPARAPELDGPQSLAIFTALAHDTGQRNITLDAAARAFARPERPAPPPASPARQSWVAPKRKSVIAATATLLFSMVYGALAMWDASLQSVAPAPPQTAASRASAMPHVSTEPRMAAEVARSPSAFATELNSSALKMDGSRVRPAPHDTVPERSSTAAIDASANAVNAAAAAARGGFASSPGGMAVATPDVKEPRSGARPPAVKTLTPSLVPTSDALASGGTRAVACRHCDCPSLTTKRTFTSEPLRREELEYLRRHCG